MPTPEPIPEPTPMYGLQKGSQLKEIIVKKSEVLAIRYEVIQTDIDLQSLRREKKGLEAELALPEPKSEEIFDMGRASHPYYLLDRWQAEDRIRKIDEILSE